MYNKPKMDPCIIGSRGIWILFVSFWTQVMSIVESQNFYEPSGINSVDASGIVVNVPWASTLGGLNFRQSMVRWAVTSWHLVISCVQLSGVMLLTKYIIEIIWEMPKPCNNGKIIITIDFQHRVFISTFTRNPRHCLGRIDLKKNIHLVGGLKHLFSILPLGGMIQFE